YIKSLISRLPAARNRSRLMDVFARRQTRNADPGGVNVVSDIQGDQQGGDLFKHARVLQTSAVERPHARDLLRQLARHLAGLSVVCTDDDVAIDRSLAVQ